MLQGQEPGDSDLMGSARTPESQEAAVSLAPAFHRVRGASSDDSLGALLRAAGAVEVSDLESVVERLEREPGFRAVIAFPNPVLEIAGQLKDGESFEQGVAVWRETMEPVLAVFRRDRRRITLVDDEAARCAPDRLLPLLNERSLGLQDQPAGSIQAVAKAAKLKHLIAAQALALDDAAALLHTELEASALPLGPAYRIDFDALAREQRAAANVAEQKNLRAENEQLQIQLSRIREELEAHIVENRKLEKIRLAKNSLEEELEESREEWVEERKVLAEKLSYTAEDLAAMRQSLSWRLTSPLRRILGLFMGGTKL